MPDNENAKGRRGFFQEALLRVMRPVADALESKLPNLEPLMGPPASREPILLRPPGAVAESEFASTCRRCGACVSVCPVHAIFALDVHADDPRGRGTPVINADLAACVVCDGLKCTTVCPSGALRPLKDAFEIHMGLAEVDRAQCVRSSGQSCTICVDKCPIGPRALRFVDGGPPEVMSDGCVGCGVCQFHCPTTPKAIVVHPHD